jgi:hypothetical protein
MSKGKWKYVRDILTCFFAAHKFYISNGGRGQNSISSYNCVTSYPPPLWSSGQSSWLQIQSAEFDPRRYQIFWEVVGLERVPLSLVSTTEELRGRKSSSSGVEIREYGRRDSSRWPLGTLHPQTLALTSPTSGDRSVGIVCSRTQATKFSFSFF